MSLALARNPGEFCRKQRLVPEADEKLGPSPRQESHKINNTEGGGRVGGGKGDGGRDHTVTGQGARAS